jgi:hypothetical protein
MPYPLFVDGGNCHQMWRVDVNILSKQSHVTYSLSVEREATHMPFTV